MTPVEMQYAFDSEMRAHKKLIGINLASSDILLYLNRAQEELIRKHFALYNFEASSRKYLSQLVGEQHFNGSGFGWTANRLSPSNLTLDLPINYHHSILDQVTLFDGSTNWIARVVEVLPTYYNLHYNDPYKQPYRDMVWKMILGSPITPGSMEIQITFPTGYTIVSYNCIYLQYPQNLTFTNNVPSQLDVALHYELVRLAVHMAEEAYKTSFEMNEEKVKKDLQ